MSTLSRQEYNRKIVEMLKILVEEHPDYRFGQLIQNYGVVNRGDCFFIESEDSYNNLLFYSGIKLDEKEETNEPIECINKIYIKGVHGRGKEVIEKLEERGGRNTFKASGERDDLFYTINADGWIEMMFAYIDSRFDPLIWEELFLDEPSQEETKKYIIKYNFVFFRRIIRHLSDYIISVTKKK